MSRRKPPQPPKKAEVPIDCWLWLDLFKNQDTSVLKAKKAISDYKKAIVQVEGLAEFMVFDCERAAGFSDDVGLQDECYFDALVSSLQENSDSGRLYWPGRLPYNLTH